MSETVKFVQIAAVPETAGNYLTLYALDASGRIWELASDRENGDRWKQIVAPTEPEPVSA